MSTHLLQTGASESGSGADRTIHTTPASIAQFELTVLRCRVVALETALKRERARRQAVVERYERLLEER